MPSPGQGSCRPRALSICIAVQSRICQTRVIFTLDFRPVSRGRFSDFQLHFPPDLQHINRITKVASESFTIKAVSKCSWVHTRYIFDAFLWCRNLGEAVLVFPSDFVMIFILVHGRVHASYNERCMRATTWMAMFCASRSMYLMGYDTVYRIAWRVYGRPFQHPWHMASPCRRSGYWGVVILRTVPRVGAPNPS